MKLNTVKRGVARIFDTLGLNTLGFKIQRAFLFPFIRVVNYHDILSSELENFERQLEFFSSNFVNVTPQILKDFLNKNQWIYSKPGIILTFDDGLRSHYEYAAPMLEKHLFTGWFFVISGSVTGLGDNPKVGREWSLTSDQLKYLAEHHVVGCHTETHCRLDRNLDTETLTREIVEAKASIEKLLEQTVTSFAWVGGEEWTYSRSAADVIKQAFELSFMTNTSIVRRATNPLQMQRTNIEAENPLWLVRFQISGLMDLYYYPKRRRVNKLTA